MAMRVVGKVLGIAVRQSIRGPMREIMQAEAIKDAGLVGDVPSTPDRGITFISSQQWQAVTREIATILMWPARRANVLIQTGPMVDWVGGTLRLGSIRVVIKGESKPCELMDEIRPGLRAALEPEGRGGVYGRIIEGGSFSIGDPVELSEP